MYLLQLLFQTTFPFFIARKLEPKPLPIVAVSLLMNTVIRWLVISFIAVFITMEQRFALEQLLLGNFNDQGFLLVCKS